MVNQSLVEYLKDGAGKGYPVYILRDNLLEKGWPITEIEDAISEAKPESKEKKGIDNIKQEKAKPQEEGLRLVSEEKILKNKEIAAREEAKKLFIKPKEIPIRKSSVPVLLYVLILLLAMILGILFVLLRGVIGSGGSLFG